MERDPRTRTHPVITGLLVTMLFPGLAPPRLHADGPGEAASNGASGLAAEALVPDTLEQFVRLEVRENDLRLTNVSDRPINAWSVKQVVRSSQGYEAYTTLGVDAFRSPKFPGGEERLLQPGESVILEKGEEPWIREDHRGPGSGVFFEVGALTFEGGEAVGDPEIVDRIFARRLDLARSALKALEVTASAESGDPSRLDDLPPAYRGSLEFFGDRDEALRAIQDEALTDYEWTVDNLRPQDLARLPSPEDVLR